MPFNALRQAILTKIVSEETDIQEAYFSEVSEFVGSPAAVIGVSQNEGLYNSQKVDRMTFVFQIRIYIPIKDKEHTLEVEERMGKAFWNVLTMFNNRKALEGHADIVEPLPSVWGFEERGPGLYRFSEINLRCVIFMTQS